MRRHISILCLCLAWLCANGAVWNVVQTVAWARMFHAYSRVMPAAKALQLTFDGSAPCNLCLVTQKAQDAARDQLPAEAALDGADKFVLTFQPVATLILAAPEAAWPDAIDQTGLQRTEVVPLPPPRA